MKPARRILYFCHDYPAPSGGVRVLYTHVELLRRHGYDAYIVHNRPNFQLSWIKATVPILYLAGGLDLQTDDIAVIPEDYTQVLLALRDTPITKYIFCQNHFFIFHGLPPGETWQSLGITGVLASSQAIADFIKTVLGYASVPVIPCQVNPALFRPEPKLRQIAYMPRKRSFEVPVIQGMFCQLYPQFAAMPWVKIDSLSEAQTAKILAESRIFLALGRFEGLGLPPLEAMACGCIVVGFHGQGGLEYATAENGFWVEGEDLVACARQLGEAIAQVDRGESRISQILEQGLATARRYSPAHQEAQLLAVWSRLLAAC